MAPHTQSSNRRWLALAALGALLALVVACGSSRPATTKSTGAQNGNASSNSSTDAGATGQKQPSSSNITTNASTDTNVAALPSELDRKIVRVATLTLTADNIAARFQDASNVASLLGGFVSNSTFGNNGDQ